MPLATHYDNFTTQGGKVILCPHCAESARVGEMGLKRNAEIGTMAVIGTMLINASKVMDY